MAKIDIYQQVTDTIIEALENGVVPWVKDWKNSAGQANMEMPYNGISKNNYNGTNILLLWLAQHTKGYSSNVWLTYKQASELGGNVIKGEKATKVIYFKKLLVKDELNPEKKISIPMIKGYNVFNLEQFEGIEQSKLKEPENLDLDYTDALRFGLSVGANIEHGGNTPCYYPQTDRINMPNQNAFNKPIGYESALLHELTHWTGHNDRLNRGLIGNDRKDYAFEELIAELGSAFLCAKLGLPYDNNQHENYIDGWLKVLKEDKKAVVRASSQAQKACDYLLEKKQATAIALVA